MVPSLPWTGAKGPVKRLRQPLTCQACRFLFLFLALHLKEIGFSSCGVSEVRGRPWKASETVQNVVLMRRQKDRTTSNGSWSHHNSLGAPRPHSPYCQLPFKRGNLDDWSRWLIGSYPITQHSWIKSFLWSLGFQQVQMSIDPLVMFELSTKSPGNCPESLAHLSGAGQ